MRIPVLLARGSAKFDQALARVREVAKHNGLEGALNALFRAQEEPAPAGQPRASTRLDERLREAAARLATLIGSKPAAGEVVSLERSLAEKDEAARARQAVAAAALTMNQERGDGVCPFTGVRAENSASGCPVMAAASDPTLELAQPAAAEPVAPPAPRVRKPRARAHEPGKAGDVHEPAIQAAVRAPKRREKDKEKLAGARAVENTSGRSATRPAAKQPRGRTQDSRKKV